MKKIIIAAVILAFVLILCLICTPNKYHNAEILAKAIESENVDEVRNLLEKGIDPNVATLSDSWIWSFLEMSPRRPISVACRTGNLEIVELLIEYGATTETFEGEHGPLQETLFYYHPNDVEIVNLVLEYGNTDELVFEAAKMVPSVFDKTKQNGTVFMGGYDEASAKGITEVVKLLLGDKDVNTAYDFGKTLLMVAVEKENIYLANYLLSAGADISIFDNKGKTALDYAIETENEDLIFLIKNQSTDSSVIDGQKTFDMADYQNEIELFASDKNVGMIADEETAIEKAKALWVEEFGGVIGETHDTISDKKLEALFDSKNDCWLIKALPPEPKEESGGYIKITLGGGLYAIIQNDGAVVAVWFED